MDVSKICSVHIEENYLRKMDKYFKFLSFFSNDLKYLSEIYYEGTNKIWKNNEILSLAVEHSCFLARICEQ